MEIRNWKFKDWIPWPNSGRPAFAGMTFLLSAVLSFGASIHPVLEQERGFVGATHVATFTFADMTETNVNTPQTNSTLFTVADRQRVELIGMELVTAFNAGNNATGSVLVVVGDGAAGADFYLDSTELDSNKTEVWSKFGRAYQGVTTATSANMTNATATATLTPVSASVSTGATATATLTPVSASVSTGATATATLTPVSFVVATNGTVSIGWTPQYRDLVYLDAGSNIVTNSVMSNALVTATFTPDTATLNYAGTNAPTVTVTAQNTTLNYAGTNAPAVTVTAQNTTLNYAGTNAPTVTVTAQTESQTRVTALTDSASGRKVYTADDTIDFVFTPNSVNALSENTAGEVRFYFKVIR